MKCKAVLKDCSKDNKFNIKIRITLNRKVMYIKTDYYVLKDDFNEKIGRLKVFKPKAKDNEEEKLKLIKHEHINAEISRLIASYESKYASLSNKDSVNDVHSLITLLQAKTGNEADFYEYIQKYIKQKRKKGKTNYADSLLYTINVLKKFTKRESLLFSEINYSFLKKFEEYLSDNNKKVNSIAVYMRNIRLIFNKAINDDIIDMNIYPFRKYKIKVEKTSKRNIGVTEFAKIRNLQLTDPLEIVSRDIFMLSFYLIGMNLIDIFHIKNTNTERIDYKRAKTTRNYSIKVHPEAKIILKKYSDEEKGGLIFKSLYSDYRNFTKVINKKLKTVADKIGIDEPITTYYSRHSWATIASDLDIPRDIIRQGLGHGLNTVTDIYIDFDLKKVDEANKKIIDKIVSAEIT